MPTYKKEYRDINLDFTANPVTGDIASVKDTVSVKRGIRNVLLTENFERLFNPELGSGIKNLLFEQMTPITEQRLQDEVASAINAWEQRAEILSINVISEDDFNRYRVQVRFRVINTLEEEQVDVFLARER